MRKIIQVVSIEHTIKYGAPSAETTVLCDDGTIWRNESVDDKWTFLNYQVPQGEIKDLLN